MDEPEEIEEIEEKKYKYIDVQDEMEYKIYMSYNRNNIKNVFINFFSAVLSCIDENFDLTEPKYKIEKIRALIFKMIDDYDKNDFYYKYYYNKNKKIKKTLIKLYLHKINNNSNVDNVIYLQQFISDYFSLNIFILSNDKSKLKIKDDLYFDSFFNSNEFNNKINKYCPTIILYKNENKYYPFIKNKNSLFSYSSNYDLLKHLYNVCEIFIDEYKYNKKTLVELREISKEKNININKKSKNTGKIIFLRKTEIMNLLRKDYVF